MAKIGVYDSGVGGLSVLKELLEQVPQHEYVYLADLAHVPYGTKSAEQIIQYARRACQYLIEQGVELIVLACNTISALALPVLQHEFDQVPIVGIIETSVEAVRHQHPTDSVLVLATEATVKSHVYVNTINAFCPGINVITKACGVFVAIVEEGWTDNEVANVVAEYYLQPLFERSPHISTVVLGCTHFSFLKPVIQKQCGARTIIDSSMTCAKAAIGAVNDLMPSTTPSLRFLVTDMRARFETVAKLLLNDVLPDEIVLKLTSF